MAHRLFMFSVANGLVQIQTACTSLNVFFSSMGLTASKSEVMLFTRKHERPPILVRVGSYVLPQTSGFKYLGIAMELPCKVWCDEDASKE
jgi:hypothetical protein